jgi:DtxR family Mn-dependent transcriptional regulator
MDTNPMNVEILSASLEDYLEAIYHIVRKKQAARAKDISDRLGVNRSSVTGALHSLSEKKLINYAPYDIITLTAKGETVAEDITRRHTVLRDFFVHVLGVDRETAEGSACGMEHAVSELVLDRLAQFVDFINTCPRADIRWNDKLGFSCEKPESQEDCERCIDRSLTASGEVRKKDGQITSRS